MIPFRGILNLIESGSNLIKKSETIEFKNECYPILLEIFGNIGKYYVVLCSKPFKTRKNFSNAWECVIVGNCVEMCNDNKP